MTIHKKTINNKFTIFHPKRKQMKRNSILTVTFLMGTLTTGSWSGCTKSEVIKLIDKGFSKAEISNICDLSNMSQTAASSPKGRWIDPGSKACRSGGGYLEKGICSATRQHAKDICRIRGGRLPAKHELMEVIAACGGDTANNQDAWSKNKENKAYRDCFRKKGFSASDFYWSSTPYAGISDKVWYVEFDFGGQGGDFKINNGYVRCISTGK